MRPLSIATAAAAMAATLGFASAGIAATDGKCSPDALSKTLHERLKQDGKTDADIRDILGSSMKRRVMTGRISDGTGCSAEETEKALQVLETAIKHG